MVQRDHWLDPRLNQRVEYLVVERNTVRVRRPSARRLDPRPRDRHPVVLQPHARHQPDVFLEPVVVVTSHIPVLHIQKPSLPVVEIVPDAPALVALCPPALDLVRGGRGAPQKPLGELEQSRHPRPPGLLPPSRNRAVR